MPTRVRSTTPSVSGGGGGPAPGGTVGWGPDFGEGAGSDGTSNIQTGVHTDLHAIDLAGNATIGVRPQVTALSLAGLQSGTTGVLTDLEALGLSGNTNAAVLTDLRAVDIAGNANTGVLTDLASADIAGGSAASVHCAGSVLGAPFWQSVGQTRLNSVTGGTSLAVPAPSGLAVDDLMLAVIGQNSTQTVTPPAGWTSVLATTGAAVSIATFWKIATSGDVAAGTFTFTYGANVLAGIGEIHRIIATDATTPINASTASTGGGTSITAPSVTTTVANCLVFIAAAHSHTLGSETHTPATGHVERTDQNDGTVSAIGQTTDTRVFASAAATGTASVACTVVLGTNYAVQRIAVAPGSLVVAP